jgi:hypothetical protein
MQFALNSPRFAFRLTLANIISPSFEKKSVTEVNGALHALPSMNRWTDSKIPSDGAHRWFRAALSVGFLAGVVHSYLSVFEKAAQTERSISLENHCDSFQTCTADRTIGSVSGCIGCCLSPAQWSTLSATSERYADRSSPGTAAVMGQVPPIL